MPYRDDCEKKRRDLESAGLPDDTTLPYFAYGFFKPHQLSYSQIKYYVEEDPIKVNLKNYRLKNVNGMPVLVEGENNIPIVGYLIKFKKNKLKKAYETIGHSKNMHIYKWEEIKIGGTPVNTLIGSNPELYKNKGNYYNFEYNMEIFEKKLDEGNEIRVSEYDWRKDPIFSETIKKIYNSMGRRNFDGLYHNEYDDFLEIQMLYMALWTALDRFLTFRYGKSKRQNVIRLSKERFFKNALNDYVETNYTVFSAEDLKKYELNPEKPACCALYYYTIRNNVVHSGKMFSAESEKLFAALTELVKIFEDVIDAVSRE